jgi:endonuclease-3
MKSNKDFETIFRLLEKNPNKTYLDTASKSYRYSPFQVLVSTVLSQRTKDIQTDRAAKSLFKKFNSPKKIADAGAKEIQGLIKPAGFYKTKARRIKELSRQLIEKFNGRVPANEAALLSLPGVGQKTAACVMVYAFNIPAMPVDTHVHRVSNRIGWAKTKTPEQTQKQLMKTVPRKYWLKLNDLLVRHGQTTCLARKPKCFSCKINSYCNYFDKIIQKHPKKETNK